MKGTRNKKGPPDNEPFFGACSSLAGVTRLTQMSLYHTSERKSTATTASSPPSRRAKLDVRLDEFLRRNSLTAFDARKARRCAFCQRIPSGDCPTFFVGEHWLCSRDLGVFTAMHAAVLRQAEEVPSG